MSVVQTSKFEVTRKYKNICMFFSFKEIYLFFYFLHKS